MSISWKEIVWLILTIIASAGSIWLGTYDRAWESLGIPAALRGSLTVALTIAVTLIGFLLVMHSLLTKYMERMKSIAASTPYACDTIVYRNGEQALAQLTASLPNITNVLNTIIGKGEWCCPETPAQTEWTRERLVICFNQSETIADLE